MASWRKRCPSAGLDRADLWRIRRALGRAARYSAQVHICEQRGEWLAIVYSRTGNWTERCNVSSPWPRALPYSGPCRSGWVHRRWVGSLAGWWPLGLVDQRPHRRLALVNDAGRAHGGRHPHRGEQSAVRDQAGSLQILWTSTKAVSSSRCAIKACGFGLRYPRSRYKKTSDGNGNNEARSSRRGSAGRIQRERASAKA